MGSPKGQQKIQVRIARLARPVAVMFVLGTPAFPARAQHVHAAPGAEASRVQAVSPAPGAPETYSITAFPLVNAPAIDGRIEPGEWAGAARFGGFTQTEPAEGKPETERTEVLVARDESHLYLAFIAHDSEIERVRADLTPRDRIATSTDVVGVVLDPQRTGSRGYVFLFNPLGVQYDGVWTRGPDLGWDGVLRSRGRVETDRYVVEVAIPFTTVLAGGSGEEQWSVNFGRRVTRKGEESWWAPVPRAGMRELLKHSGVLGGISDSGARMRFELIPTATARGAVGTGAAGEADASWGATLRLPLRPTVRLDATYRPDFSYVESDAPQIGFNERFALFYPEKRPFFLDGKDLFETRQASFVSDPIRLVHTRTIVRPRAGVRLLASPEDVFLGAMLMLEERPDGALDGTSTVLRAAREWTGGARAGLVATRRDREDGSNTVVGADAQLKLPAGVVITAQAAGSTTETSGIPGVRRGTAAYLDVARETGRSFQQVVYRRIGRDFDTELGFLPRSDFQQVVGHAGVYWRPKGSALLSALPMVQHVVVLDDAGRRTEIEHLPHVELLFTRQTALWLAYRFGQESYRGRAHGSGRAEGRIRTSPTAWLDISLGGQLGTRVRYDPDTSGIDQTFVAGLREMSAQVQLRIGSAATLSTTGILRHLGGAGEIAAREVWLGRVRAAYHLSPETYVRAVVQYDPDQDRREGSLLLGHEINYGTQAHLGVEYASTDRMPGDPARARRALFARISYLLQQ